MDITYKEQEIGQVAKEVLERSNSKTMAFYAPMGAGKTTLIKAMLGELGAEDAGSSPTFGIVNEYHGKNGDLLAYHFDFYRLNDEMEALDMGLEDYLGQDCHIFMEWPEKIPSLVPPDAQEIRIEIVDIDKRKVSF